MTDIDRLTQLAERVRASGVLGRPGPLHRLFDYLTQCSRTGKAPKEIDVAVDVFGKASGFDASQDAVVRVYIHKLRRKLAEYYAGDGQREQERIVIPKGEYRLALQTSAPASMDARAQGDGASPSVSWTRWLLALIAAALLLNAAFLLIGRRSGTEGEFARIRAHPIWASILDDDLPVTILVGDYYIFGESDGLSVTRMVREFAINSRRDLDEYLQMNPKAAERYVDMDLTYLPTSIAFAMRDLLPVLASPGKPARPIRVALMSEMTPAMLRHGHVIYIGLLSGLGSLQEIVLASSRFSIGETYDELVDSQTKKRYVSEMGMPPHPGTMFKDYGYFGTFPGPADNQFIVIAGTRDVAVMQTAEALTRAAKLDELQRKVGAARAMEALYEVGGLRQTNITGSLVLASPLDSAKIWSASQNLERFP